MPLWRESWVLAGGMYFIPAPLLLVALPDSAIPQWTAPVLVITLFYLSQTGALRNARRAGSTGKALAAASLQGMFLISLVAGILRGTPSALIYWAASLLLLIGGAVAAVLSDAESDRRMPRYGLEGLLMTFFLAVWLFAAQWKSGVAPLASLIVIHGGILTSVVVRNSAVVVEHVSGPAVRGKYVEEEWRIGAREPGGIRAVPQALALPSGIVGSVLVSLELAALAMVLIR